MPRLTQQHASAYTTTCLCLHHYLSITPLKQKLVVWSVVDQDASECRRPTYTPYLLVPVTVERHKDIGSRQTEPFLLTAAL